MNVIHVTTNPYSDLTVTGCPTESDKGRMASRNSEHRLALVGTYYRFGLGYSEPNTWENVGPGMGRKFITEPSGYTFGLSSCIAANPAMGTAAEIERNRAADIEHDVSDGDVIVTDCQYAFRVRLYRREFLALDYLGVWSVVRAEIEGA